MPQARQEASAKLAKSLIEEIPAEKPNVRTMLEREPETEVAEKAN